MAGMLTFTLSAAVACNSRRRDSTVLQTEWEEGSAIAFCSTCEVYILARKLRYQQAAVTIPPCGCGRRTPPLVSARVLLIALLAPAGRCSLLRH